LPDALASYLSRAMERPFSWDGFDCFLFCADWELEQTGLDLAAGFRGTYSTERQARHLMKAQGGIIELAKRCCDPHLLPANYRAGRGDIGLVQVPLMVRGRRRIEVPAGAICFSGDVWVVKSVDGLTAAQFPVLAAWQFKPVRWSAHG
jgi:hypothetical protein